MLMEEPEPPWQWPAPPFDWRHTPPPEMGIPQPCRVETPSGAFVDGWLVDLDPPAGRLDFRASAEGQALPLPLLRVRRLTLVTPLRAIVQPRGHGDRMPRAEHERQWRALDSGGNCLMSGMTVGHVETPEGLFIFTPVDNDNLLQREFVPRPPGGSFVLGLSVQDVAAERWHATPRTLLAALAEQHRLPVRPLGESLLALGMVTPTDLERTLAAKREEEPLGEALVARGLLSGADLHTAIAHKMGYPFVDLTRFPVDPAAARKLPLRMAVAHRSMPILFDGQSLIVAMDRPQRAVALQQIHALAPMRVVPVLASKGQILLALSALSARDSWAPNVTIRAAFFATTA